MVISTTLESRRNKDLIHFIILILVSIIALLASVIVGASMLTLEEIVAFFTGQEVEPYVRNILVLVRVPRALGGFICGVALATAGVLLQTALNNALASPSTIGVNAGAGMFVLISAIAFPLNYFARTFSAFLGAVVIAMLVYFISVVSGTSKMTIVLAGTAVSTLCNAIIDTITIINPESVYDKTDFYIGGLSGITYTQLMFSSTFILIGFVVILFFSRQIDIMILGDEVSSTLGVNVRLLRLIIILCASLMAGASVAMAGLLGFVGLIIPHIALYLFDNESKTLIPKTALLGGVFVVLADLIARTLYSPYEVPVGIILSMFGAPFFIYLLFSGRKRGRFI